MSAWLRHPWRVTGRVFWLAGALALGGVCFVFQCAFRPKNSSRASRARWLQQVARRLVPVFDLKIQIHGELPPRGLLVCNHLSYVDIVALAATMPTVFVAKSDIKHWPVFGWFARGAGSIFVDRQSRAQAGQMAAAIETVLNAGQLLILFPEGTSSGGETVLPFKSSLLEPAVSPKHLLWVGLIAYALEEGDGDPAEEVCYWKDMTLTPHLINLLSKRSVRVAITLAPVTDRAADRKALACQLHDRVLGLRPTPAQRRC